MERILGTGQIQDGLGTFQDAAQKEAGLWTPDRQHVPRPSFDTVLAIAKARGLATKNSRLEIGRVNSDILPPGIRGVARFLVRKNIVAVPAIVLRDGRSAGVLLGQEDLPN
jgi:hypothetical protein